MHEFQLVQSAMILMPLSIICRIVGLSVFAMLFVIFFPIPKGVNCALSLQHKLRSQQEYAVYSGRLLTHHFKVAYMVLELSFEIQYCHLSLRESVGEATYIVQKKCALLHHRELYLSF